MKTAVVLTGSVRDPMCSINTLRSWGAQDIDVYIHTWKNIKDIHPGHWLGKTAHEPDEWVPLYNPVKYKIDDWEIVKESEEFEDILNLVPNNNSGTSPLGMFYSLNEGFKLLEPELDKYDCIVRMRFDNSVSNTIFELPPKVGWNIPENSDFGGVNDRFGWLLTHRDTQLSRDISVMTYGYFGVYENIINYLINGVPYQGESLLKAQLDKYVVPVNRVGINYSILGM